MYKKNIVKKDIINNLSKQTGFSDQISKKLINDLINILIENIKLSHVNLKNIGSFVKKKKNERTGRNPKTKEVFTITSRYSVKFKLSKNLSKKLHILL